MSPVSLSFVQGGPILTTWAAETSGSLIHEGHPASSASDCQELPGAAGTSGQSWVPLLGTGNFQLYSHPQRKTQESVPESLSKYPRWIFLPCVDSHSKRLFSPRISGREWDTGLWALFSSVDGPCLLVRTLERSRVGRGPLRLQPVAFERHPPFSWADFYLFLDKKKAAQITSHVFPRFMIYDINFVLCVLQAFLFVVKAKLLASKKQTK